MNCCNLGNDVQNIPNLEVTKACRRHVSSLICSKCVRALLDLCVLVLSLWVDYHSRAVICSVGSVTAHRSQLFTVLGFRIPVQCVDSEVPRKDDCSFPLLASLFSFSKLLIKFASKS